MHEIKHLIAALSRSAQQDWRQANSRTTGPVTHVNAAAGKARIRLGGTDEEPFLSPWTRYSQTMGALKIHTPVSIGQLMDLSSDSGDFETATLTPRTQSDDNASPSERGDENVVTFGNSRVELRGDDIRVETPKLFVKCGSTTFELTAGGLKAVAPDYDFGN